MRALFGLDPDGRAPAASTPRTSSRRRWASGRATTCIQILRGPGHALAADGARARRRLDALIFAEIDRRRARGERGEDILSLLLEATDEDGATLCQAPHPRRGHDA